MELELKDGRYTLDGGHALREIDGAEELAQRVALRLRVHRGAFLPLPDYGSRLYTLGRLHPNERETAVARREPPGHRSSVGVASAPGT